MNCLARMRDSGRVLQVHAQVRQLQVHPQTPVHHSTVLSILDAFANHVGHLCTLRQNPANTRSGAAR